MTGHDLQATEQGPRADRTKRRTFTPDHKLRIVEEYDSVPAGGRGALSRQEGPHDSSLQL